MEPSGGVWGVPPARCNRFQIGRRKAGDRHFQWLAEDGQPGPPYRWPVVALGAEFVRQLGPGVYRCMWRYGDETQIGGSGFVFTLTDDLLLRGDHIPIETSIEHERRERRNRLNKFLAGCHGDGNGYEVIMERLRQLDGAELTPAADLVLLLADRVSRLERGD